MAQTSHPQLLDRIYAGQKHIYDLTRKYFLFGRDTLLYRLEVKEGDRVLEVGTGTARNLLWLARRHPGVQLFGLDASREMLRKAEEKVRRLGRGDRIALGYGLAESFTPKAAFGEDAEFEKIIFSYSLSMMPNWRGALQNAFTHLAPGGEICIVDFWDQSGYPELFQRGLEKWLSLFHVQHDPELLPYCERCAEQHSMKLTTEPIGRRYAVLISMSKTPRE